MTVFLQPRGSYCYIIFSDEVCAFSDKIKILDGEMIKIITIAASILLHVPDIRPYVNVRRQIAAELDAF